MNCQEKPDLSSAVAVEYNDAMFLGEVVAVCRRVDGRWHAQIIVEQILTGLQSLISLRDHLLGEGSGATVRSEEVRPCVYA